MQQINNSRVAISVETAAEPIIQIVKDINLATIKIRKRKRRLRSSISL